MTDNLPAVAPTRAMMTWEQKRELAEAIARSRMFGMQNADQALVLMALCEAEGMHPVIAVRDYHIIQGRPTLKADAMLARFQAAGGSVDWHEITDAKVDATFTPPRGSPARIDWTPERAKKAELGGKDNWKKFTRQMLRSRVISEGVRTTWPGVLVGIYTPEEAMDMEPITVKDVTPPKPTAPMVEKQAAKPLPTDWKAWGAAAFEAIKACQSEADLNAWAASQHAELDELRQRFAPSHAKVMAAIDARVAELSAGSVSPQHEAGSTGEADKASPATTSSGPDIRGPTAVPPGSDEGLASPGRPLADAPEDLAMYEVKMNLDAKGKPIWQDWTARFEQALQVQETTDDIDALFAAPGNAGWLGKLMAGTRERLTAMADAHYRKMTGEIDG